MKLKIDGKIFDFFNKVTVDLKFDSVASTFKFVALFDHTNQEHLDLFRPFSYRSCEILSNRGDLLIKGTILNNVFTNEAKPTLASINGYSKPGVLEDSTIPVSLYPLQFDGLTLKEITNQIIKPFGIGLVIDGTASADANVVYDIQKGSEAENVKSFISRIASQKNIVLSHDKKGNLVFTKGRTNTNPVAKFSLENGTATKITLSCNGQKMHNKITVQKEADIEENNAGEETISNPFVSVFRPTTKTQTSGTDNDTAEAAKNALGTELKGLKLTIETDRLEWLLAGKFETIEPNRIISVIAPECYILKETKFFIESVSLKSDETSETAIIKAVLPEVYTGNIPKNIFR